MMMAGARGARLLRRKVCCNLWCIQQPDYIIQYVTAAARGWGSSW
jgi:hypothetical protein